MCVPESLVHTVCAMRETKHVEFELRLGRRGDENFTPGVPRDVFEQLERDLDDASSLQGDRHWTEVVDYHYRDTHTGDNARTRVEFDTDQIALSTQHIVKTRVRSVVLIRTEEGDEACRAALSTERPLSDPPHACLPTCVRVKQRRCFRDVRDGRVVWSYELSKTWTGNTRSAVEHLQHMSEPVYEVECELVDEGGAYMSARSDSDVARSVLLKASMLLGDDGCSGLEARDVMDECARARKRRR